MGEHADRINDESVPDDTVDMDEVTNQELEDIDTIKDNDATENDTNSSTEIE